MSLSFIGIGAMLVILGGGGGGAAISIAAGWMTIDPERSVRQQMITASVPAGAEPPPIMVIAIAQLANLPIGMVITSLATLGRRPFGVATFRRRCVPPHMARAAHATDDVGDTGSVTAANPASCASRASRHAGICDRPVRTVRSRRRRR